MTRRIMAIALIALACLIPGQAAAASHTLTVTQLTGEGWVTVSPDGSGTYNLNTNVSYRFKLTRSDGVVGSMGIRLQAGTSPAYWPNLSGQTWTKSCSGGGSCGSWTYGPGNYLGTYDDVTAPEQINWVQAESTTTSATGSSYMTLRSVKGGSVLQTTVNFTVS
jgi:hypothetical protein